MNEVPKRKTFKPIDGAVRVLAWGCGTPSTALGVMSALGKLERLDAIIHVDTGWEAPATVTIRNWYANWFYQHGIPVHIVSGQDIRQDGVGKYVHIPLWTSSGAPLRRQCSRVFKIDPQQRFVRKLLGFNASLPPHPPAAAVEQWIGFTIDETMRMKDSHVRFIVNRFPLIEQKMFRSDCVGFLEGLGLPIPPKSACICCPYRSASEWIEIRDTALDEWAAVCEFDAAHRFALGRRAGVETDEDALYIYKHCVPLASADLDADAAREKQSVEMAQLLLPCGDGSCWT